MKGSNASVQPLLYVLLALSLLHAGLCAVTAYASPDGQGTACSLNDPCSIHIAASRFSGIAPYQGKKAG